MQTKHTQNFSASHLLSHCCNTLSPAAPFLLPEGGECHDCSPVRKVSKDCRDLVETPSNICHLILFADGLTSKENLKIAMQVML